MKTSKNSKTNNKSKAKKGIVDRYYCDLYDTYLYVANEYATVDQIRKYVRMPDGSELDENIFGDCAATTIYVLDDKETTTDAILVKYCRHTRNTKRDKKVDFVDISAHEALHVALGVYKLIGQNVYIDSDEPLAYLVGWVAQRIYKTIIK